MKPLSAIALAGVIAGPSYFIAQRASQIARVAPDLRNTALLLPFSVTNGTVLRALRAVVSRPTKSLPGVVVSERQLSGDESTSGADAARNAPVRVFVYEPEGRAANSGALLWIHSGGRVAGSPVADHRICSYLAQRAGTVVVSVDYRLAPEHPFPAAVDDICTALMWLQAHAADMGIDPSRVAIGGASAGGGLAAEVCQWAVDADVPVAFQLLVYPMLDDRTVEPDPDGRGLFIWTAASNRYSWEIYLGHTAGVEETRPYAAAARRDDLTGLPPAWIGVGELDLFYGESIEYAARLEAAGVPCDVDVVPGMYHGADVLPMQPKSMQAFWQRMATALAAGIS